jgi:hypothetical protein
MTQTLYANMKEKKKTSLANRDTPLPLSKQKQQKTPTH